MLQLVLDIWHTGLPVFELPRVRHVRQLLRIFAAATLALFAARVFRWRLVRHLVPAVWHSGLLAFALQRVRHVWQRVSEIWLPWWVARRRHIDCACRDERRRYSDVLAAESDGAVAGPSD